MARDLSSTIDNAIDNETSFRFIMRMTVEPSYIYIDSVDDNDPISSPDPTGITDDPVMQDIVVSPTSGSLVTFFNDGGTLKYIKQGSSTTVTTSVSLQGKPGCYGGYVYTADSTNVVRRTIDWSQVEAENANPFSGSSTLGAHSGSPAACHGVSDTRCVVLHEDDGGLRTQMWDDTTSYDQPGRFMFPRAIDYTGNTTSGSERSYESLATFSGAMQYGEDIHVYVSNPQSGAVEGISWSWAAKVWSDTFQAVSTDIQSSLCEFRVANAYSHNGSAYLVGQFRRTENVGTDYTYSMVLSSQDGKTFSLDGFTLVSQIGYRFLATVGAGRLFLGNCNRVSSDLLTYVFDGTSGSDGLNLDIPMTDIISFKESNVTQNELRLRAGDDIYAYHAYIEEGARVKLYLGYNTSSGDEDVLYATYIIDSVTNSTAQGQRHLSVNLVHISEWKLTGLSSPYYNEFFAKSSVYDDCSDDSGNLYVAPNLYDYRDILVVDFWGHIEYENAGEGITGLELITKGGVDHKTDTGSHKYGMRTRDLTEILDIGDYPEVTGNTTFKVYGWSRDKGGGTSNDITELIVFVKRANGDEDVLITNEDQQWPNYYPSYAAHDGNPLTFNFTSGSLAVGDKVQAVGMVIEGNNTQFCPTRIELTSGFKIKYNYSDGNTPWTADVGKLKVPNPLRPYIMFSQKPYDAWNSFQVAEFTNSCDSGVSGYPIGAGLVCLAMDGGSYILGRYDKNANKWEIVKVRDGQETVLKSVTPSDTVPETYVMGLSHRDGTFTIWWEKSGQLQDETSYDWTEDDGWMYESTTISRKCGIWGYIGAPWFETSGVNFGGQPGTVEADGIPYLPGFDVADWPSSGKAKIGDNVYSYSSKVESDPVLGPHQFRQSNKYEPPYGNGGYGLENLYMEWTRSNSADSGKLCGCDNGGVYIISSSDYTVWHSTAGVREDLMRSRQYSANEQVARNIKYLSTRVYVTGGLKNIDLLEGENRRHRMHEKVNYNIEGDVAINWYKASSGRAELTLRDLIRQVSEYSGASAEFPGDTTITSASPGASVLYNVGTHEYVEGIDLRFETDVLTTNQNIEVVADVVITPTSGSDSRTSVKITKTGSGYNARLLSLPSQTEIERVFFEVDSADELPFRFVFHDEFITVDIGESWVYTFATESLTYQSECDIYLRSNDNIGFRDILLSELSDWREAIYIDLETDGRAALGSVIQERPIETCHESNGSISYWYDRTRDRVTQVVEPRRHSRKRQYPRGCASDAIVYYSDVAAMQNTDFAARYGFSTKVYRFPSLTVGAIRAANILMQRQLEAAYSHKLQIRPDLRLEVGDVLDVDFYASGTNKRINMGVIVESLGLVYSADDANPYMDVDGREEL